MAYPMLPTVRINLGRLSRPVSRMVRRKITTGHNLKHYCALGQSKSSLQQAATVKTTFRGPLRNSVSVEPRRWHSAPSSQIKQYEYNDVKKAITSPDANRILIDVREPNEYAEGHIPTAVNIPVKSSPEALYLPDEEFLDKFGFEKPAKSQEVVFYCRSGVRSNAAASLAERGGFEKIYEYRGSWLDWTKNGGPESKGNLP